MTKRKKNVKAYMAACVAILMAAPLLLTACNSSDVYPAQLEPSNDLPPVETLTEESTFETPLYFISNEQRVLFVSEERAVEFNGKSYAESAVQALIDGPKGYYALDRSIPVGMTLDRVELSTDACNVYLSGTFPTDNYSLWLIARVAIAETVYAAEGIGSVNVYFNEMEWGYSQRPLGVATPITEVLDAYLVNLKQEYEVLAQPAVEEKPEGQSATPPSTETRTATLYFTNEDRSLLLTRNKNIAYSRTASKADISALLIEELKEGDSSDDGMSPVLPADFELAADLSVNRIFINTATSPTQPQTPDATEEALEQTPEYIVELHIKEPRQSFDEETMCGALTLTLSGFIPNIRGVRIFLQDDEGNERQLGENDYFTRLDFTNRIGYSIPFIYPDDTGAVLKKCFGAVPSEFAYDPDVRLAEMLKAGGDHDPAFAIFDEEDVLDVYIVDDMAVINWSEGFSNKLLTLKEIVDSAVLPSARVQMFIYSVVNTMCEMSGVHRVWMMEDGKKLGMADQIYLGNALLGNPGLMED